MTSLEYVAEIKAIAIVPIVRAFNSMYPLYPNNLATPITTELPPKNIKYMTNSSGTPLTTVV